MGQSVSFVTVMGTLANQLCWEDFLYISRVSNFVGALFVKTHKSSGRQTHYHVFFAKGNQNQTDLEWFSVGYG